MTYTTIFRFSYLIILEFSFEDYCASFISFIKEYIFDVISEYVSCKNSAFQIPLSWNIYLADEVHFLSYISLVLGKTVFPVSDISKYDS